MQILNEVNPNNNDHLEEHVKPAKVNFLDCDPDCNQTVCSKNSMNLELTSNTPSKDNNQPLSEMLFNDSCLSSKSESLKSPLKNIQNIANLQAFLRQKYPNLNLKPQLKPKKPKTNKKKRSPSKSKSKSLPLSDGLSKLKESQNSSLLKAVNNTCTQKARKTTKF